MLKGELKMRKVRHAKDKCPLAAEFYTIKKHQKVLFYQLNFTSSA
ncbi:hypothetical protein PPEP_a3477 [Pseudoalteromonas peptidolytica F12-50-A1]|uniref:Uncharacterized protein n=1 Tax=Pseudoalteromonas peptidolytica F12-50-A1 TaxID=1315280 RepID=A0A8I0T243_9GAMM|nr:hypothetical protein [Pseudoalteromonas peptidolytica F12-50-A1]